MDYQEIKPFVRQWLFLLGGTILWYLYQSIHNRNTAFFCHGVCWLACLSGAFGSPFY